MNIGSTGIIRPSRLLAALAVALVGITAFAASADAVVATARSATPPPSSFDSRDTTGEASATTEFVTASTASDLAAASTSVAPESSAPATGSDEDNSVVTGWSRSALAWGVLVLVGVSVIAIASLVYGDRRDARVAQLKALRMGFAATQVPDTVLATATATVSAAAGSGSGVQPLEVKGPAAPLEVGATATLTAKRGGVAADSTWSVDDPAVVALQVSGTGAQSSVKIVGLKVGSATVSVREAQDPTAATVALTVVAAAEKQPAEKPSVAFRVLGSGVGAAVVGLVALSLVGIFGLVGELDSATIATLLGVGLGSGAAFAAGRSSQGTQSDD